MRKFSSWGIIPLVVMFSYFALNAFTVSPACPPPHGSFGKSLDIPDSDKVVCLVDNPTPNHYELYVVDELSGQIVKLSQDTPSNRNVILFEVNETGTKVAYTHDTNIWTQYELYSVWIDGIGRTKLSGGMPPDNDVDDFIWSSNRVVYRKGRNATDDWDLRSADMNGVSVLLSQPGMLGVRRGFYSIGNRNIRFAQDVDGSGVSTWYSTKDDGGPILTEIFSNGFESGTTGGWR